MPGPQYPQNPLFKSLTAGAYALGKTLPKKRAKPPISVAKYKGVTDAVKGAALPKTELGQVTVPYGGRTRYEKVHPGIDIAAVTGTPVMPYSGGVVSEVRRGIGKTTAPSFGNFVIITDKSGNKHRYSHLNESFVKVGQEVTPKSRIGTIGATGSVYSTTGGTGAHLDYRIKDAYGKYIDPSSYLKRI